MKIIGSDYDGTLNRGGISDRDADAIMKWQANGNLFAIVTGRGGDFAAHATKKLKIKPDFVLCGSGTMIYDRDGVFLSGREMSESTADALEEEAKKRGAPGWGRVYEGGRLYQFSTRFPTTDEAADYTAFVNASIDGASAYQNGICIDVVRRGLSKATGLAELAAMNSVEAGNVTAVGDSYNDLSMIEAFGGYAIRGSAVEALAPNICDDIAQLCGLFG